MKHILGFQLDIAVFLEHWVFIAVSGIHIIDVSFVIPLHIHLVREKRIQSEYPSCPVPYDLGISISPY